MRLTALTALPGLLALPALLLLSGCQSCVDEGSSGGSAPARAQAEPPARPSGSAWQPLRLTPSFRMRGDGGAPAQ
ncbi:MAG: hypothetical protein ACRELB_24420 [Polyangiaceae bacterium]